MKYLTECSHEWCNFKNCECQCHYNYIFTIQELKTIYNLVEREYIPYENEAAHAVINKIAKIIKENE